MTRLAQAALSLFCFVTAPAAWAADTAASAERWYNVADVLSGDSFQLEGGAVIRYASAAAPDPLSPSKRIEEFAAESLAFNRALLAGKRVRVEWGSRIRDQKSRYVGYVFLDDGTFANQRVLEEGFAKLVIEPPNLEHADVLRDVAMDARRARKGLWRYERETVRVEFVGDKMKRIFHYGDCVLLEDVAAGHRETFRSAVDATAADFTFCKLCKEKPSQSTDLF